MGKININLVVEEKLLNDLQNNCAGNRNGFRSKVKRHTPVNGVDVTVPDDHEMESTAHKMTDEELIEFIVWTLAKNRVSQL